MKRSALIVLGITVLLVAGATIASAGDHLNCYRVKDKVPGSPERDRHTADLISNLDPAFSKYSCKIDTPAKYCCAPVDKVGIPPNPPPAGTPHAEAGKFCCYKVRCKVSLSSNPYLSFNDQFGNRAVALDKEELVCAPAD
jgi:hypothetical protein